MKTYTELRIEAEDMDIKGSVGLEPALAQVISCRACSNSGSTVCCTHWCGREMQHWIGAGAGTDDQLV